MARRDDKALKEIDGYKIKTSERLEGPAIFVTDPGGVNFSITIGVMYKILEEYENDKEFRDIIDN